jgi:hypothetical protein
MAHRKCEICGAVNESVDSFAYDDYYESDSVKVYSHGPKLERLIAIRKTTLRVKRKMTCLNTIFKRMYTNK